MYRCSSVKVRHSLIGLAGRTKYVWMQLRRVFVAKRRKVNPKKKKKGLLNEICCINHKSPQTESLPCLMEFDSVMRPNRGRKVIISIKNIEAKLYKVENTRGTN